MGFPLQAQLNFKSVMVRTIKTLALLLMLMQLLCCSVFAQSIQYEPVGNDETFFNTLMWVAAQDYAIDNLGAPDQGVLPNEYKPGFDGGVNEYNALALAEESKVFDGIGTPIAKTITLYPRYILAQYPELITILEGGKNGEISDDEAWEYFKALLGTLMYHELLHHCYGMGSSPESLKEQMDSDSCQHASIEYATHLAICGRAEYVSDLISDALEDLEGLEDPDEVEEQQDLIDKLTREKDALCRASSQIAGEWNKPENLEKLKECIDGKSQTPEPAPKTDYPVNGCPGGYPQMPDPPASTESGFEDDIAFSPCSGCEDGQ